MRLLQVFLSFFFLWPLLYCNCKYWIFYRFFFKKNRSQFLFFLVCLTYVLGKGFYSFKIAHLPYILDISHLPSHTWNLHKKYIFSLFFPAWAPGANRAQVRRAPLWTAVPKRGGVAERGVGGSHLCQGQQEGEAQRVRKVQPARGGDREGEWGASGFPFKFAKKK